MVRPNCHPRHCRQGRHDGHFHDELLADARCRADRRLSDRRSRRYATSRIEAVGISNDFPMAGQTNLPLNNDNAEGVKEYLPWVASDARAKNRRFRLDARTCRHSDTQQYRPYGDDCSRTRQSGFRSRDIDRVMGGNWRRVLTDVPTDVPVPAQGGGSQEPPPFCLPGPRRTGPNLLEAEHRADIEIATERIIAVRGGFGPGDVGRPFC